MPDLDDLEMFDLFEKVKQGFNASQSGWNIDVCPYMSDVPIKAWRFGYKLHKLEATRAMVERIEDTFTMPHVLDEARQAYANAKASLEGDMPRKKMDVYA
jgi:hypothetical protein